MIDSAPKCDFSKEIGTIATLIRAIDERIIQEQRNSKEKFNPFIISELTKEIARFKETLNELKEEIPCEDKELFNFFLEVNIENISADNILHLEEKYESKLQGALAYIREKKEKNASKYGERGPYRSYTLKEKEHVIQLHKAGISCSKISKQLKIPQKNVVRWCKDGVQRKAGAGRKIADREMEENLVNWIYQTKELGDVLKFEEIQTYAFALSKTRNFKASKGWFKNFVARFHLNDEFLID